MATSEAPAPSGPTSSAAPERLNESICRQCGRYPGPSEPPLLRCSGCHTFWDTKCFGLAWPGHRAHCKERQRERKNATPHLGAQSSRVLDGTRAFIDRYGSSLVFVTLMAIGESVSLDNLATRLIQVNLEYNADEPHIAKCMTLKNAFAADVDRYMRDSHAVYGNIQANIERGIDHITKAAAKGDIAVLVAARCGDMVVIDPVGLTLDPKSDVRTAADQFGAVRSVLKRGVPWEGLLHRVVTQT